MGSSAQVICTFLQKLLSEETIADKAISKTVKAHNTFRVLAEAEAIVKTKKGGGHRWEVADSEIVKKHLEYLCPNSVTNIQKGERYNNIRKYRSSKAKKRESCRLAFIRGEGKVWLNDREVLLMQSMPLGSQINTLKALKVCFVENQENFMEDTCLISNGWTLIYPIGRIGISLMSKIVPNEVLHYGDLDYEGLNEFARIKEAFPQAKLFVPENYFELSKKYGMEIKSKQKASSGLIELSEKDASVKEVLDFLHIHNLCLEQEGYDD